MIGPDVTLTCHCGAVEVTARLSAGLSTLRRCDCSFCSRRGAAAVSAPIETVEVKRGRNALTLYQFGTMTARHYFCRHCGIYMYHRRRSDPSECGLNAACIPGVHIPDAEPIPWVDGRDHPRED